MELILSFQNLGMGVGLLASARLAVEHNLKILTCIGTKKLMLGNITLVAVASMMR